MAKSYKIFIWKKAPAIRVLVPVVLGIILEYYLKLPVTSIVPVLSVLAFAFVAFSLLPLSYRFKYMLIGGVILTLLMLTLGGLLLWNKDVRNHPNWYAHRAASSSYLIATIKEPIVEKDKSYKALATVNAVVTNDSVYNTRGKILLYFSKDSFSSVINYGDKIIIKKDLQAIKNSGNPAAFDYKSYCSRQQIFYQCYLLKSDWLLLNEKENNVYDKIIFTTRAYIIKVIDTYIKGSDEASVAKALLIGYKADLDKDLVQAYSNAGVIHIIVIAGLHLGLIYALLFWLTGKISFIKNSNAVRFAIILTGIWFFALLTGAAPPVMRAAVMFTFIAVGNTINKKGSVYNSLAASAFLLLCIDPYALWDAGFQLSYLAVTSIAICYRHIYRWLYVKTWLAKKIWEIVAVSLAAQVLTLPALLYYFHQMPLLFIFSNIIAIPLAIFSLYGSVLLICVSFISSIALYIGKALTASIWLLNHSILFINNIPFSVWRGFSLSITQTFLLYIIFISFLYWILKKNMLAFKLAIACGLALALMIAFDKWNFSHQRKIIVYTIPSHKAIDFIDGNKYHFVGDSALIADGLLKNFNVKPSRIFYRLNDEEAKDFHLFQKDNFLEFYNKKIVVIDTVKNYAPLNNKIHVDYIIISKNPKLYIPKLAAVFNCDLYIFDASNPFWKIEKWKKDCEDLHLRFYSVPEQGAFVTDL